jgi:hypothetical protein
MTRWRQSFDAGADNAVIGLSPAELRSMIVPACIIPGNDRVHPRNPGQVAHRLMPNSEYHEVLTEDRMDLDVAFEDWEAKEGLLAAIFIDFLRRQQRARENLGMLEPSISCNDDLLHHIEHGAAAGHPVLPYPIEIGD